ncbi:carbamate kinase [Starkeya sp. ORNL1]|uniref:carbamate kinase n=1 Tax=Starkeya sp. ORNL1 TaxID=2709380 RepID=UPI001463122A|nr:carbamate kinase [Starkeya sp. ORNL1]QJP14256.1 carbamate kinase [Starkeya sp. ORNL1]
MRIVVALGGNALLRRGEPLTAENQRANIRRAAQALAELVEAGHSLIITHGNGPQVGLLALQAAAGPADGAYPLDVLGAESEGMIGYLIEQELGGLLRGRLIATLLTQVRVAADDPAFSRPTKPIGPVYDEATARHLARERKWQVAADGAGWRRVVASPRPLQIMEARVISMLVEQGVLVICAGGGGIPVVERIDGSLAGVEAVIDKDFASALLATELGADMLLLLTDVDAVYLDYGTPAARAIRRANPAALASGSFPAGSMGPKIAAACEFASGTGRPAAIGQLGDALAIVRGERGTRIDSSAPAGIELGGAD